LKKKWSKRAGNKRPPLGAFFPSCATGWAVLLAGHLSDVHVYFVLSPAAIAEGEPLSACEKNKNTFSFSLRPICF